jgi:caffeoyl-CoA O-methyltransferase
MPIFHEESAGYLRELALRNEDPLLAEMHAYGAERKFPLIGPEVGRFLSQLVHLTGARRIFELGSGFGYSALWFARALPDNGEIVITDGDPENIAKAKDFLGRAGLSGKVTFLAGYGQDLLQATPGLFDIVFCDVDKEQYPEVYPLLRTHLRVGGAFVIDNLLWSGRVADPEDRDASTLGIRAFTDRMWESPEFLSSLLPVRDGVGLCVRLR